MNNIKLIMLGGVAFFNVSFAKADFIKDAKATATLRNYYFDSGGYSPLPAPDIREWGQGLQVQFQSGFTEGKLGVGVDVLSLTGIKLDSGGAAQKEGISRSPGTHFPLNSDGKAVDEFSSLGLTAKVRFLNTDVKIGTLLPQLPIVSYNTGRLLPQTFEGWQISDRSLAGFSFTGGRLSGAKGRASTDVRGLSIEGSNAGSLAKSSNEFYYAGLDYAVNERTVLQYYLGNLEDFYVQHFLGFRNTLSVTRGVVTTELKLFNDSADGKNASALGRSQGYRAAGYWQPDDVHRGTVDNTTWSLLLSYSLEGHQFKLGRQQMTGNSVHMFLNQADGSNSNLMTERQINAFNNAGERTWVYGYSYDFAAVGIPGLSTSFTYAQGDHIASVGGELREWERDIGLSYVIQSGPAKGLSVTWLNAMFRGEVKRPVNQDRIIISYGFDLF